MTLDENSSRWEHARLRYYDHSGNEYGIDDGSEAAEEAMHREYMAAHHAARRVPGLIQDEREPTLHAERVADGLVVEKDWQVKW